DLGSTNGTFLGQYRVGDPVPVETGTAIRIGRTVIELRN
ncbi:MAG TPA: FHA domain-containing protein, partial [Janibacter terrae]|nr:FHA domain-containing protein [Janibacter terrae]